MNRYMEDKISEAIKLLQENGYIVKRLTKSQITDSKKCDEYNMRGEDMDCTECSCSCCILL